ncbi:unnamed protein product [Caenorhabditis angaria]|uniref:Ribonuclease H1 n=1 Tax=Caenorhabditis angaria TaxID=860376 RepID=A0A9P1IBW3_9PELO|nr:unnamed protein product [Caenorhabditis angaria]
MGKGGDFYAVARGKSVGIYRSWADCSEQVKGFQNARFKKFPTESEARKFIADNLSVPGGGASTSNFSSKNVANSGRPAKRSISKNDDSLREVEEKRAKIDQTDFTIVYTDGACSNNGRENAKAGWGVYWGDDNLDNSYGPVYGEPTNNRGELIAVEKALETAIKRGIKKVLVKTDSNLLIQSLDKWILGWRKKGWKTADGKPVKNRDLLEKIDKLRGELEVQFEHVRGHCGIDGNEKADELARKGAQMYTKF